MICTNCNKEISDNETFALIAGRMFVSLTMLLLCPLTKTLSIKILIPKT